MSPKNQPANADIAAPAISQVTPHAGSTAGGASLGDSTTNPDYDPTAPVTIMGSGFSDYYLDNAQNLYTAVEYLNFTGQQYINTGIDNQDDTRLEVVANSSDNSANAWKSPAGTGVTGGHFSTGMGSSGTFYYSYKNASFEVTGSGEFAQNIFYDFITEVNGNTRTATANGVTVNMTPTPPIVQDDIFIGGVSSSSLWTGDIKSVVILKSGVLVRDFVPVCSSAGVGGMFDRTSGEFHPSATTTAFDCSAPPMVGNDYASDSVSVTFGTDMEITDGAGVDCTSATVLSATEITCVPSAHPEAAVKAQITVGGQSVQSAEAVYTYRAPMSITSVTPDKGPIGGGTNITISGHNLQPPPSYTDGTNSYTEMPYLEYNGGIKDRYIDTGIIPAVGQKYEVEYQEQTNTKSNPYFDILFGSRNGMSEVAVTSFYTHVNGASKFAFKYPAGTYYFLLDEDTNWHNLSVEIGSNYADAIIDGTKTRVDRTWSTPPINSLFLGNLNQGDGIPLYGQSFQGNIKSWKVSQEGVGIIQDFVPVCSSAGVGGMWDKVSGAFFGSASGISLACVPATTVTLDADGTPAVCENVVVVDNDTITCETTAHTAGPVAVKVDNGVENASLAAAFTYVELYLSMSVTDVEFSVTPGGGVGADNTTATVKTNNPTGYNLSIEADPVDLVCATDSNSKIEALDNSGLGDGYGPMVVNHWGFAVDPNPAAPSQPSAWRGLSTTPFQFKSFGTETDPDLGDKTALWFGSRVNYRALACKYTGTITITALAN